MSDPQTPIRILAVDSESSRQERYRSAIGGIAGQRFALLPADSGGKALALVRTFRPDCVVVATALPDMTVKSFIERLGRSDASSGPAVVAVAPAPASEADGLAAIGAGADDYVIAETLTPAQLCRALGRAIAIVSLRRLVSDARRGGSPADLDDPLTGLGNRSLFHDRLVHAVTFARRNDQNVGLMLVQLSQLKEINVLFGHEIGDEALREAARRLKATLREADTVARTSGNQFGALLQTGATYEGSRIAAEKVQRSMSQPFQLGGRAVDLAPQIGIALFPNHSDNSDMLLHHAETALRQARRRGAGYAIFAYDDLLSDFLEAQPSAA